MQDNWDIFGAPLAHWGGQFGFLGAWVVSFRGTP